MWLTISKYFAVAWAEQLLLREPTAYISVCVALESERAEHFSQSVGQLKSNKIIFFIDDKHQIFYYIFLFLSVFSNVSFQISGADRAYFESYLIDLAIESAHGEPNTYQH